MTSRFRYTVGWGYDYRVQVRPSLDVIGHLQRYERHYNLARPFTIKGWIAHMPNGKAIGRASKEGEPTVFRTRDEAAKALEEAS